MTHMKKVLLIARARSDEAKQKANNFADRIRALIGDDIAIENCEITELMFEVSQDGMAIYHPQKGFDLREFDLVVIRHIGAYAVEAHAITLYCQHLGIKYTDEYLNRLLLDNKLSTEFLLWLHGVTQQPRTFYGPTDELVKKLDDLGGKAVLKDNEGSKGRLNFVVHSADEIRAITTEHADVHFLLQEFIPNDSDLRVLVLNGKPKLVIKRSGDGSTHLNNTSQGGQAAIVPLSEISESILDVATRAANITKLQVAGVDVVINKETGAFSILEVNNAPQISSGSFMEEKAALYTDMLREMLEKPSTES